MKSAISVSRWESDQSSQKSSGKSKTRTFWNYSEDVYNSEQNEISQGKQGRRKIQKSAGDEYFTSLSGLIALFLSQKWPDLLNKPLEGDLVRPASSNMLNSMKKEVNWWWG